MLAKIINIDPITATFYNENKLLHLDLSGLSLTYVPAELRQLTNLQVLDLSNNQLSEVPAELGRLTNLQSLALYHNQLSEVPAELGQLTNLQRLTLYHNQLSEVPAELGQLTNLQTLYLNDNQLSQVPVELGQLTSLQELNLSNNPSLLTPPPEIVSQRTSAILTFLRELQKNSTMRYEAKLLIVGEGGTGKSSLLRSLHNEVFDPHLATTHGIAIQPLSLSSGAYNMTLHVWDFGGQHIYHATHQFFLTERSLYLVVWNARLGAEQGRLDYWLDTIKTLAPNAPVLLVATHIDERPPDLNYPLYQNTYPQLVGNLSISNQNGIGIDALKEALSLVALKLPLMGQPWPQQWLDAENVLSAHTESYIDAFTYVHNCANCGVEENIANGTLGNYLHDLGKILYFRDEDLLSDLVVLQPEWVTQAIAQVLDNDVIRQAKGILRHADLPHIWKQDASGRPYERRLYPILFRLMERFELSYQLDSDLPEKSATLSLIPLLLPHQPPIPLLPWPNIPPKDQTQVEMVYRLNFVPAGIMSRFIVRTHRYNTKDLHWREGVILEYEGHQARVELNPMQREIKLLAQGVLPQNFFTVLMNTMDEILARFKGLTIRREIPCICHWQRKADDPCSRNYRYEDLIRRMEAQKYTIECPDTLVDVSVPKLLYGIHSSTNDQIIAEIQQNRQEIKRQQTELHKLDILLEKLDQQSELIGRNFTRQWNLMMAQAEIECPNTFMLLPSNNRPFNPKNWVSQQYQLFLICQHPHQPHPIEHAYSLRQAEEWWVSIHPWLKHLVTFLKFGVPMAGKVLGVALDEVDFKKMQNALGLVEEITKNIPQASSLDSMDRSTTIPVLRREQEVTGTALRALHSYLKSVDPNRIWGGLEQMVTPDGHILWLCAKHRQQYEAKPLSLQP
ncbi:hypothetical protein KSF_088560 [Reticulibacter mediterranei]|uniref:non-specific serine/threonine protein kinase n=1 Tax=Reticulibacter mediterranei TaxID=2778369 RepID=A0A8J3IR92_9CHLR|nr:hypothetical protein KSF_088560 [Reticulibacter mediterranei]